MTKEELKQELLKGTPLGELFPPSPGSDCQIFKAEIFQPTDDICYIPDLEYNGLTPYLTARVRDIHSSEWEAYIEENILDYCYTGRDFLDECSGDINLAQAVFDKADWALPADVYESHTGKPAASKSMRVIVVEPNKKPEVRTVSKDLPAMQGIVGGYLETVNAFADSAVIVCNEEAKLTGLPLNRAIFTEPVEMVMPYGNLKKAMQDAASKGQFARGYVVISDESFPDLRQSSKAIINDFVSKTYFVPPDFWNESKILLAAYPLSKEPKLETETYVNLYDCSVTKCLNDIPVEHISYDSVAELNSKFLLKLNRDSLYEVTPEQVAMAQNGVGIVVSPGLIKPNYSEESRTYTFTNYNKAFMPKAGGYSIFADSLDGTDRGVRLDLYLPEEKGNADNHWKIERSYMKPTPELIDIISGTFFICGRSRSEFCSLTDAQVEKYMEAFKQPEQFIQTARGIMVRKVTEEKETSR